MELNKNVSRRNFLAASAATAPPPAVPVAALSGPGRTVDDPVPGCCTGRRRTPPREWAGAGSRHTALQKRESSGRDFRPALSLSGESPMFVTPRILPAMLVLAAFTAATTFKPFEVYAVLLVLYASLTTLLSFAISATHRRLNRFMMGG